MSSVKPSATSVAAAAKTPVALHPHFALPVLKGPSFAGVLAATPKPPANACKVQAMAHHPVVVAVQRQPDDHAKHARHHDDKDDLDPSARQAAQLAPPVAPQPLVDNVERSQGAAQTNARVSMEELLPALVKKIAWSGDAQRGTVRMELGAGELAGSTLMVSSEGGRVRVQLQAPPGTDTQAWRQRLRNRLEAKGLSIESLEVE